MQLWLSSSWGGPSKGTATVYLWPCWFKSFKCRRQGQQMQFFYTYIWFLCVTRFPHLSALYSSMLMAGAEIWLKKGITRKTKRQQQSANLSCCYSCYFYGALVSQNFLFFVQGDKGNASCLNVRAVLWETLIKIYCT